MKKGWTITKLVAAGSVGVAMLIFSLAGGMLNSVTGVGGVGGLINVFVQGGLTAFIVLSAKQFGSATIAWLVFSFLAIALPIMGPPGFFFKIFNGILIGICSDIAYLFLSRKREKVIGVVIGGVSMVSANVPLLIALSLMGINWLAIAEGLSEILVTFPGFLFLFFLSFLIGTMAGYLGWLVYDRLKNTSVIKRIQGA